MKKVSVLCPYPENLAPSQRFRIELYIKDSTANDIKLLIRPFLTKSAYINLYLPGRTIYKSIQVINGFLRRVFHVFESIGSDYVLIHREAAPLGPPIFEWLLSKVFKKKIILDFDDAIWLSNTSDQNKLSARLKWHNKFNSICRWSFKIVAGNSFLAKYAGQFNSNVIIIPTVVDTLKRYVPNKQNVKQELVTIGWTGSHSTSKFLLPLIPLLKEVYTIQAYRFLFISNQEPQFSLPNLEYRKWNAENEIDDLNEMDIGIMPLPIDDWSRGKCGFKLIQYLSLCIPAIATKIPPNDKIIIHKENGYLCENESDWLNYLRELLQNEELREKMGKAGRKHIDLNYSKNSYENQFFKLFS